MSSLKMKTVSGVKWQVLGKIFQKGLSVVTFAILARILEPSVFGLFAMAFIVIDGLDMFKSFGFDSALVQRKGDYDEQASHTVFFITQFTGLAIFVICFIAAPGAAHFFNNQDIVAIIRTLGVVYIFSTFSKVPSSLLTKAMRFKFLSVIQFVAAVLNSVVAIGLVLISPTIWSLVWAYLAKQLFLSVTYFFASGYRPRWQFNRAMAGELFSFGKFMVGLSLLWFVGANVSSAIVGKLLGPAALGFYAIARNLTNFVNTHFTHLISRVLFPAYSRLQDDPESLKRAYLKSIKYVSLFTIPFSLGLIGLAPEIVGVLYGPKWTEVIPMIQLIAFTQIFIPLMSCTGTLFTGCGKPQYSYWAALLDLGIRIPLLWFLTQKWGVLGAISAGMVTLIIFVPLHFILAKKIVHFSWREIFSQILPAGLCGLLMLGLVIVSKLLLAPQGGVVGITAIIQLVLLLVFASAVYFAAFHFSDRETSREARDLIFSMGKSGS